MAQANRSLRAGCAGFVVAGTTGESSTLDESEYLELIGWAREAAAGQIPVIAGCSDNATERALSKARAAEQAGANALLVATPHYNKPEPEGLLAHYETLHKATKIPVILYNVPGRTGVNLGLETIVRLSRLPRIIGLKDSTSDITRPARLVRDVDPAFTVLAGEDSTAPAFWAQGARGSISVTANLVPEWLVTCFAAWQSGNAIIFNEYRDKLTPLHQMLFLETSPAPLKYALHRIGIGNGHLRLPLTPPRPETCEAIDDGLERAGLLEPRQVPKRAS